MGRACGCRRAQALKPKQVTTLQTCAMWRLRHSCQQRQTANTCSTWPSIDRLMLFLCLGCAVRAPPSGRSWAHAPRWRDTEQTRPRQTDRSEPRHDRLPLVPHAAWTGFQHCHSDACHALPDTHRYARARSHRERMASSPWASLAVRAGGLGVRSMWEPSSESSSGLIAASMLLEDCPPLEARGTRQKEQETRELAPKRARNA